MRYCAIMANDLTRLETDPKFEELRRRWKEEAEKIRFDVRYGYALFVPWVKYREDASSGSLIEGEVISKRETER